MTQYLDERWCPRCDIHFTAHTTTPDDEAWTDCPECDKPSHPEPVRPFPPYYGGLL